jgi:CarboxypepD_reg-like domain/TonB-dependent Receptor Plug Domain
MIRNIFILCLFIFGVQNIFAQENSISKSILKGIIVDSNGKAVSNATVRAIDYELGNTTNEQGEFSLEIPADTYVEVWFSKIGYATKKISYRLQKNETKNILIQLINSRTTIKGITKRASKNRVEAGNVLINVQQASIMPSTIGGVEGLLKVFLSGNNNELTSQYNVRGGNFDENLVYINDFEVYRPFLVRSGQQEGLSVINSDLVQSVNFSTGGFQSKYGDKMSSVLDVQYRKPKKIGGSFTSSLLGASAHLEGTNKNERLKYLVGLRQKSNQYLLGAQQTSGVYLPSFTDAQVMLQYDISKKWNVNIFGNYARNRFEFVPEELTSTFGLIQRAYKLKVFYTGGEQDKFDSKFGGVSFTKNVNEKLSLKFLASGFNTNEFETYDLRGEYFLTEIETDLGKESFGQDKASLGTGIIHQFARNYLSVNSLNVGHKGSYDAEKHFLQWGLNTQFIYINDQLNEWERRDSAGFSQPTSETELLMSRVYKSKNIFNYQVLSGFFQDNYGFKNNNVSLTYGLRFNYNFLNKELLLSPRVQASWKPKSWKKDAVLRTALGLYQQPPFYREMRNYDGVVNTDLLAQKSAHFVVGTDYNFKAWNRPFRLTAETYYKKMWDLVPYEYDNVRIRYWGRNASMGYAVGTELRIYGDIVKDAESWISLGVMKTAEDIKDDKVYQYNSQRVIIDSSYPGFVPRPTDSRFTLGMFFQDYFPNNKNIKVHLSGMYGTGLPFGPPDLNRAGDTLRLPPYRRVDIGFSTLLIDGEKNKKPYYSLFHRTKSIWLSAEVFNLLGIRNTISYTWIQDRSSARTYAVPNRLTNRLLNMKLIVKF